MVQFAIGLPKHQCKSCGRQFVNNPTKTTVLSEIKQLVDRLSLERILLRGIAKVTQVSWFWLQDYVNQKLARIPHRLEVPGKLPGKLIIECDEMWSFVDSKKNEVYIWLAIDRDTEKLSVVLWETELENRPINYGLLYQPFVSNIPSLIRIFGRLTKQYEHHRAVGKETGQTNYIKRLNNTFRQRVSRRVRESLSFSKKLNNHIGAIWYFIHGYNAELART